MMEAKRPAGALNLIFDADDTLWDSNIHFLEAEAAFVESLGRAGMRDGHTIRATMRRHELRIIESHGYGRRPYLIALHRVATELAPSHHHENLRSEIERIGEKLAALLHRRVLERVEARGATHGVQPREDVARGASASPSSAWFRPRTHP